MTHNDHCIEFYDPVRIAFLFALVQKLSAFEFFFIDIILRRVI